MSTEDKNNTLLQFEAWDESGGVAVLLTSTTCGNAGLNLAFANTCIFLDIWCVQQQAAVVVDTAGARRRRYCCCYSQCWWWRPPLASVSAKFLFTC
jgi:hypothetical protein